ncbi:glycosyltransferase family 2 protein, partial [Aureobasidium melanogenum]
MSTFTRTSSTTSMSAFDVDVESVHDDNQHNHNSCDGAQTQRTPSLLVPLFGHFQWNNTDSAVVLPIQEPEPTYQEALAGVAEDPDFVEVEIEPKAGSITRRASLFANIFTNKDVDVDPDLKFKPSASEVEIKQGIAEAQKERSRRKMIYSRNIAATSLVTLNAVCIALSFGLFSIWYATAPLILLAPLLKSTMAVDLIVSHAYKKVRLLLSNPPEEKLEDPTMDYATAVSFSNESFEDIQSTLDSLVDQKDVDMHKNLLLISCNDNVWNSDPAKPTTRIILEHILTNIVDEAKFQMPHDGHDAGFDNMWCRRGIYKGLPYVLMIKEGMTNKVEFLDLIRNLLHSYNLRKESYHNSVPSAFFAWYEEWAELHDFASFDFLINVNSETSLDEHCISQLYQQALKNPACAGVLSRVEVDSRSLRWGVGNLSINAQLMYDQIRQSHQTQIMHKASVNPSACQMLRICEETCGPQILEEIKKHRPTPMSNMVKQICSSTEEDDMMYGSPEVITLQAVHAVTYARSPTTFFDFMSQQQRIAFSTCATNLAILCNNQMHWFERLSSAADLLAWSLPLCSLALIVNFLRSAALQQSIPVLIVLSAIVALPWIYGIASATWLAHAWEGRLRYLLGFCILALTGPIVAVYVVVFTVLNLHLLRPEQPKRRRSSAIAAQIQPSAV